jgi:WD40 repeat protein
MKLFFVIILSLVNSSVFCQKPSLILPIGHTVNTASYSKDGRFIVSTNFLSECKIWETESGRLIITISTPGVEFAKFASTNDTLITFNQDSTTNFIASKSGQKYLSLKTVQNPIENKRQLSKDGLFYLKIDNDYKIKVFDQITDILVAELIGHRDIVNKASFNAQGTKIVSTSYDGTCKVWDVKSGKMELELYRNNNTSIIPVYGKTGYYNFFSHFAEFSSDGKNILTCNNGRIEIYETITGKLLRVIDGEEEPLSTISFFNDEYLITTSDSTIKFWDLKSGKPQNDIKTYNGTITCIALNVSNNLLAIGTMHGNVSIWDIKKKKQVFYSAIHLNAINSISFSRDEKKLITASDDNTIRITEIGKKVKPKKIKGELSGISNDGFFGNDDRFLNAFYSNSGKYIASVSNDRVLRIWDSYKFNLVTNTSNLKVGFQSAIFGLEDETLYGITELDESGGDLLKIKFIKGKRNLIKLEDSIISGDIYFNKVLNSLFVARHDGIYKINIVSGLKELFYKFKESITSNLKFVINRPIDKVTLNHDGYVEYCDIKNHSTVYKFFQFRNHSFITINEDGYYRSNNSFLSKTHYVLNTMHTVSFEQLDTKFNRPDKVLESTGCTDTTLINAYRQAYYKRIEKLGVDTSYFKNDFDVPDAEFLNRENILGEQNNINLHLVLNASDKTTELDRYNIWINEVPIYGQKGKSLRGKNIKELKSIPVDINLTLGRNKIEFSVFNVNGIESYRQPLFVTYSPNPPPKAKTYFIGIGINKFASNTNALNWCVKDIRDLTAKLQQKLGSQFIVIDTLFDQRVTLANIKKLKEELLKTEINDKVIIVYSGHGLLSAKYDYYLSGYNVDFKAPENGGIPYDELEGLLDSIPSRNKLLLLDACNSGEVDKDSQIKSVGGVEIKGIGDSVEVVGVDKNKLGLANSFELMRELFVNVNKGTGATVIAAAQGYQSALEQNSLGHGVFTYSILDALEKNRTMKVSKLKKWVNSQVYEKTNGKQQPTTRNEPVDVDWSVW